ncbi:nucleotidyltransferase domain-containing protein [Catellatospora coxensis]|uniref:nucleotidyltransferase domain-containing protein n=1 Tax=Catellatospora coxensis TaxID=310354 RepID=UPI001944031F|nr:nucleotidyltransferase domain-containing protein [Catellatospora coxensis]
MLEELWVTAAHVRALDERVRGLVTGLFVTGSVPLGDYWPGRSDIDFVAVMDREPTSAELAALGKVHLSLPDEMPGPDYDGIYLTRAQLAAPPADGDTAPQILAGDFQPAKAGGQLNPVTWLEVARHGLPILGERPEVALDEDVLRRWLLDNLSGYWARFAEQATPQFAALPPDLAIPPDPVLWAVTGPGRLHHTLATGEVTTKTGGARHTAEVLPQWSELCERVVRSRAGGDEPFTATDGVACLRLVADVVADARTRWPG